MRPAFSFLKKAVIFGVTLFIVLNVFFYFANKDRIQAPKPEETTRAHLYQIINDPELQKTDEGKFQIAFVQNFLCGLVGEGCTKNPADAAKNNPNSYIGFLSKVTFLPYSMPVASGVEWARDSMENAGFIPHTYAANAGVGFAAIFPFHNLWLVFRNFAFLVMVIIMIVIGFMIMFRAKINAQTVISIENALPRIVIAMILITFSYAIAGLMIDLMYISIGLIVHLFATNTDLTNNVNFVGGGNYFSKVFDAIRAAGGIAVGDSQATADALADAARNAPHRFEPNAYINKIFFGDQFSLSSEIFENNVPAVAGSIYDFIPTEVKSILEQVVTTFSLKFGLVVLGTLLSVTPIAGGLISQDSYNNWSKLDNSYFDNILNGIKKWDWVDKLGKIIGGSVKVTETVAGTVDKVEKTSTPGVSLVAGIIMLFVIGAIASVLGPLILKAIIWLILMLSLFFVFMRIFFMFLGAYIQILLLVIFSPLILLMEMVPGKSAFMDWLKSLFVNLLTFPLFVVIMLLSKTIMATTSTTFINTVSGGNAAKPLWGPPFLWGINSDAFATIIAGALIFMSPDLIKSFKAMTGIKPMNQMNVKLSSFFAGGTTLIAGGLGIASQFQNLRTTLFGHNAREGGLAGMIGGGRMFKKFTQDTPGPSKPSGSGTTVEGEHS